MPTGRPSKHTHDSWPQTCGSTSVECHAWGQTCQLRGGELGTANPIIGVATFPLVLATGAALLAGARLAGWYWLGLITGIAGGVVFIHWLAWQSLYEIGALCPYCMVAWVATMIALFAALSHLARRGWLPRFFAASAQVLFVGWVAVVLAAIFFEFSDYWLSLL